MNQFSIFRNGLTLIVTSLAIILLLTVSLLVARDLTPDSTPRSVLQAQTTAPSLTCSPTTLTLTTTEQRVTATFRNAQGQVTKGRLILWRTDVADARITILNPSAETDGQGIVATRVKAREKRFEGSVGTLRAIVDNNRDVQCAIALVALPGTTNTPTAGPSDTPTPTFIPNASITSTTPMTPAPTENLGNITNKEVRFDFTVFLHGIGRGGDNVSTGSQGNTSPVNQSVPIHVEILQNSDLSVTKKGAVTFTYDPATGAYKATKDYTGVPEGRYRFRIKGNKYLEELTQLPVQVTHGKKAEVTPVYLQTGDINNDNFRNILDFSILADCFEDLTPARACAEPGKKEKADLDDDGEVNAIDLSLYIRELSNVSRTARQ